MYRTAQNEEQLQKITRFCRYLTIPDSSFNTNTFKIFSLSSLPILYTINIGKNAFQHVTSFSLRELPKLASLHIGNCSFTSTCAGIPSRRSGSSLMMIENCPYLWSIKMGSYVFSQYSEWKATGMNYQEITFGKYCFYYAENAVFSSMFFFMIDVVNSRLSKTTYLIIWRSGIWTSSPNSLFKYGFVAIQDNPMILVL